MKKLVSFMLVFTLLLSMFTISVSAQENIKVYINNQLVEFDVQPRTINGRTMVPLRAIFEKLGAGVEWDNATSTVTAQNENIKVSATIGSLNMKINGKTTKMDVAPCEIGGRTLVPARFVAEAFNCDVKWDEKLQAVFITSEVSYYKNTTLPTYSSVLGIPLETTDFQDGKTSYLYQYQDINQVAEYIKKVENEYGFTEESARQTEDNNIIAIVKKQKMNHSIEVHGILVMPKYNAVIITPVDAICFSDEAREEIEKLHAKKEKTEAEKVEKSTVKFEAYDANDQVPDLGKLAEIETKETKITKSNFKIYKTAKRTDVAMYTYNGAVASSVIDEYVQLLESNGYLMTNDNTDWASESLFISNVFWNGNAGVRLEYEKNKSTNKCSKIVVSFCKIEDYYSVSELKEIMRKDKEAEEAEKEREREAEERKNSSHNSSSSGSQSTSSNSSSAITKKISSLRNKLSSKQAELANVRKERNTQMFVNGSWQWVPDQNKIRELEYEIKEIQNELDYYEGLNSIKY